MDMEPELPPASAKKVLIIVGIVAGIGAIILITCCGIGVWFFWSASSDMPAAQAAAESFLDDLQANRIEAAYANTTKGFQVSLTKEQFKGFVKSFPALTNHTSRTVSTLRFYKGTGGDQASFRASLQAPSGPGSCTLTLIKEDGKWKVHHLSVP